MPRPSTCRGTDTGRPNEIAAAAIYLASEYADYVHGTTLTVDGGRLAV